MTASRVEGIIGTVVWGADYIRTYLDWTLPSLLAPGNLPEFVRHVGSEYRIYTRREDIGLFERHPLFKRLQNVVPTRLIEIPPQDLRPATAAQLRITQELAADARASEKALVYVMPDAVWSDGSFGHTGRSLARGRIVVMHPMVRVSTETLSEDIAALRTADGTLPISAVKMREMALRHLHPLVSCYHRHSPHYPRHGEFVLWPVGKEGLLLYYAIRDPKCFVPHKAKLSPQLLLTEENDFAQIEAVQDTDLAFGLSLTPIAQDLDWIYDGGPFDSIQLARFMGAFDAAYNDQNMQQPVRLPIGAMTPDLWRRAELSARMFFARLSVQREIIAASQAMSEAHCHIAARMLVAGLRTANVHNALAARGRVVAFIPTDASIRSFGLDKVLDLFRPAHARELRRLMAAHVTYAPDVMPSRYRSFGGNVLEVTANSVNGIPFAGPAVRSRRIIIQPVSGLPIHWTPTAGRSASMAKLAETSAAYAIDRCL